MSLWVSYSGPYVVLCGLEPYLDLVGDHCTIRDAMFHSSSRKWNSCQWCRPSHVYCSHILLLHSWHCIQSWLMAKCIVQYKKNTVIKPHKTLRVYLSADPWTERTYYYMQGWKLMLQMADLRTDRKIRFLAWQCLTHGFMCEEEETIIFWLYILYI